MPKVVINKYAVKRLDKQHNKDILKYILEVFALQSRSKKRVIFLLVAIIIVTSVGIGYYASEDPYIQRIIYI